MAVDPKFLITLKNKEFVLLGGLLQLAHEQGVLSIQTEIVAELCVPAESRFVVKAIGRFPTKQDSLVSNLWTAYGDASPANSQMRGAELRHAETRAIARMLRWATNCPTTAFEELGPDTEPEPAPAKPARVPAKPHQPTAQPAATPSEGLDSHCSWKACKQPLSDPELAASMDFAARPLCPAHLAAAQSLPRCSTAGCKVVLNQSTAEQTLARFGQLLCARHAAEAVETTARP